MQQQKTTMVYGINAVCELIKSRASSIVSLRVEKSRNDRRISELLAAAEENAVKVERVSRPELDSDLAHSDLGDGPVVHQGVVAICRLAEAHDDQYLKALVERQDKPFLLILDGVTDPHNLGACLRSANAAGVDAVIIPRDNAVGLTPAVRKVACGAAEITPLVRTKNLARCIETLKQAGIWVMGAAGEAESSLYDLELDGPIALVLGAEGRGLRRLTRDKCDRLYAIPMQGSVESLNVSVAAGISLFEAMRQRM